MTPKSMRYKSKSDNTAATVIDGEAIIVNLTTGVYYSMDMVGAVVWNMLESGVSIDQISAEISARYEVEPAIARSDIDTLVQKLVAEDLVTETSEAGAAADVPPAGEDRQAYTTPSLEIYRDMGDLLALDPPMPGLRDIPLREAGQHNDQ